MTVPQTGPHGIYLVDDHLTPVPHDAVTALEDRLGITLPQGYRQMVTTLGPGTYCDDIWMFMPDEVEAKTDQLRQSLREYYFWDVGAPILNRAQAEASIRLGYGYNGDEIIFNPDTEHSVYILPRHDETIYWQSPGFDDPIGWHSTSGKARDLPPFRYFEPNIGRAHVALFTARKDHRRSDVAALITKCLGQGQEIRRIAEESSDLVLLKAVGGHAQLTSSWNDSRIGIRISYHQSHQATVQNCVESLIARNFYLTERSKP